MERTFEQIIAEHDDAFLFSVFNVECKLDEGGSPVGGLDTEDIEIPLLNVKITPPVVREPISKDTLERLQKNERQARISRLARLSSVINAKINEMEATGYEISDEIGENGKPIKLCRDLAIDYNELVGKPMYLDPATVNSLRV